MIHWIVNHEYKLKLYTFYDYLDLFDASTSHISWFHIVTEVLPQLFVCSQFIAPISRE